MVFIIYYKINVDCQVLCFMVSNYENVNTVINSILLDNGNDRLLLCILMVVEFVAGLEHQPKCPGQRMPLFCYDLIVPMTFILYYNDREQIEYLVYASPYDIQIYTIICINTNSNNTNSKMDTTQPNNTKLIDNSNNSLLSGCYIKNPAVLNKKQYNKQKILLPIQHIQYQIDIVNGIANTRITQIYYNPCDTNIQVFYYLPALDDTYVYQVKLRYTNSDTQLCQQIQQQQTIDDSNQTHQTTISTIGQNNYKHNYRKVIKYHIGDILAKQIFTIHICMVQQLKVNKGNFYRFQLPDWTLPTYKTLLLQKCDNNKLTQIFPNNYHKNIELNLRTTNRTTYYKSINHQLKIYPKNPNKTKFIGTHSLKQSKDFIFQFLVEDCHLPSYALGQNGNSLTIALSFIPKFDCKINKKQHQQSSQQNYDRQQMILNDVIKGEYIFLIDPNGLTNQEFSKVKQALIICLLNLPQNSYFNILNLGDNQIKIFKESQRKSLQNIHYALQKIKQLNKNQSNFKIQNDLKDIISNKLIEGYLRNIYLLTSKSITNSQDLLQYAKINTKYARIHTIGLLKNENNVFLQQLAKVGKGKSITVLKQESLSQKMIQLFKKSLTASISKIYLCTNNKQIQSIIPNPKTIPYIIKNQPVNFYITYHGPLIQNQTIYFRYTDPITFESYNSKIIVQPQLGKYPFINKIANFKVLKQLQKSAKYRINTTQNMVYRKIDEDLQQLKYFSTKHKIASQIKSIIIKYK